MNRIFTFTSRNLKELLRDPLSYIFCLGFPLVMLVIMSIINGSIPPEAGMTLFRIDNLAGGIAVFGLSFVMLFTCLTVAKDRAGAFLVRLYATPMRSSDFIAGYILPVLTLAVAQLVITFGASFVVSLFSDVEINVGGLLLAVVCLIPSAVLFITLGLLFGSIFSEKAAPGLCSVIISAASLLGGVWFDADGIGGVMLKICQALPFYHSTKVARAAVALDFDALLLPLVVTTAWAVVVSVAAVLAFKAKMRADLS